MIIDELENNKPLQSHQSHEEHNAEHNNKGRKDITSQQMESLTKLENDTPQVKEENNQVDSTNHTFQATSNTQNSETSSTVQKIQEQYVQKLSEIQIINEDPYLKPYEAYIKERINKMNK